ncbi:MAG TPA: c-type cytochrome [Caulobacteraceae bacterium]|jgi:cytochrome c
MSSDLQFNKYAGAILATALAITGLGIGSEILFEPDEAEKPGYAIAIPEEAAGGDEGPALPPDWGTLLPAANVASGATVSKKCVSCHTFENGGANGTGPNLWGVLGAAVAAKAGFAYSPALKGKGGTWTYDEMNGFLAAPAKHVPGTKMTFVGLKNVDDRVNIIAYLRTMTSAPPPIPAPDPARQPGAAPAAGDVAGAQGGTVPTGAEGAAGLVPAPAGGATGTPPTAAGGGMSGQTPTYGQPGAAPQAMTPSGSGEQGGKGVGAVRAGEGGTTGVTGTRATARPAQNPQARNPAAQPPPSQTRGAQRQQ